MLRLTGVDDNDKIVMLCYKNNQPCRMCQEIVKCREKCLERLAEYENITFGYMNDK